MLEAGQAVMTPFRSLSRTSMEQTWQIPQDSLRYLMEPLKDLKAHGFDTLLQSLFLDLKVSGGSFRGTGGKSGKGE